ncbi:MFS transporter [Natrinema halophilum]|uniref:MFS transporter n=1 Tax=Natrinema halophilum TaxID=1699371 RepID=UPI001F31BF63|nr:MFS transporter [Natrinema halophilum]UHQ96381.1 MFS transporter [Natrinema halophilum]
MANSHIQTFYEHARAVVGDLQKDGRGWMLMAVSLGWLVSLGVRLVFPTLLSNIRSEFGMSLSTAGLLLSMLWAAYALMQLPGGIIADRMGERTALVLSCSVSIAGIIFVILAPSIEVLFLAIVLVGVGTGLYGTTRVTVVGTVFQDRGGVAMGLTQAAGNVGTTLLPTLAGLLAVAVGWRWGLGSILPFFILALTSLWITLPQTTATTTRGDSERSWDDLRPFLNSLRHRPLIIVNISMALNAFVYQSFTSFYPTYLVVRKGLHSGTAATLLGLFFASGIVIQPVAGIVSDRLGTRVTLAGVFGGTVAVLAVLPFVSGLWTLVLITVPAALLLAVWPITNSYVVSVVPGESNKGAIVGTTRFAYLLFGATGPIAVGIIAEAGSFDRAFLLLAGIALVASVTSLFLSSPSS